MSSEELSTSSATKVAGNLLTLAAGVGASYCIAQSVAQSAVKEAMDKQSKIWAKELKKGLESVKPFSQELFKWSNTPYNSDTAYARFEMTSDGVNSYLSLQANNTAPLTDTSAWMIIAQGSNTNLTWSEDWNAKTTYQTNYLARYNGSIYLSKVSGNTGHVPNDPYGGEYWSLFVPSADVTSDVLINGGNEGSVVVGSVDNSPVYLVTNQQIQLAINATTGQISLHNLIDPAATPTTPANFVMVNPQDGSLISSANAATNLNQITAQSVLTQSLTIPTLSTAGVLHNNSLGNISSGPITTADLGDSTQLQLSNDYTTANVGPVANTIMLRDTDGSTNVNAISAQHAVIMDLPVQASSMTTTMVKFDNIGTLTPGYLATGDLGNSSQLLIPNSNTTADVLNTPNAIMARDADGSYQANVAYLDEIIMSSTGSQTLGNLATGGAGVVHNDSAGTLYSKLVQTSDMDFTDMMIPNANTSADTAATSNALVARDGSGGITVNDIQAANITATSVTIADLATSFTASGASVVHTDVNGKVTAGPVTTADLGDAAQLQIPNVNTTATDANTPNAIVARDASGAFSAQTITVNQLNATNVSILGSSTEFNITTASVTDPTQLLAADNTGDIVPIGIYGKHVNTATSVTSYNGIIRDPVDGGIVKIYDMNPDTPENTTSYDPFLSGILVKTSYIGDGSGNRIGISTPASLPSSWNIVLPSALPIRANQGLLSDALGNTSWNDVMLAGGNQIGADLTVGTMDNFNLNFLQNNTIRATLTGTQLQSTVPISAPGYTATGTGFTGGAGLVHNDTTGVFSSKLLQTSDLDTNPANLKIPNYNTTADTNNTLGAIVNRDSSTGGFSAGDVNLGKITSSNLTSSGLLKSSIAGLISSGNQILTADLGDSSNLQIPNTNLSGNNPINYSAGSTILWQDSSNNASVNSMTANVFLGPLVGNGTGTWTGPVNGSVNGASSANVLKAGDTMSGPLVINAALTTNSAKVTGLSANGLVHTDTSGNLSTTRLMTVDLDPTLSVPDSNLTSLPTTSRTANTIVKRDAFNNINADLTGAVNGAASANVLKSGDTMSGALTINNALITNSAQVKGLSASGLVHNDASGNLSTTLLQTSDLDNSTNLSIPNANLAGHPVATNTANTIMLRDASGNVAAGQITGTSFVGPVTGATGNFTTSMTTAAANVSSFTTAGVVHNDASGNLSSSLIVNSDIANTAAITDAKLATIITAGKVANSATTADDGHSTVVGNTIVLRTAAGDINANQGNFTTLNAQTLNISGDISQVNSNIVSVGDAIIALANGNTTSDITNIGFTFPYNNPSLLYGGLLRDATDGYFKFLAGLTTDPSDNSVSSLNSFLATLKLNALIATGAITANSAQVVGLTSAGLTHNDASGHLSTSLLATADLGSSINLQIPDNNLASAPTSSRTANTIVKRDASNNINADVTGSVTGAASLNVLKAGDTMTGGLTLPSAKVSGFSTAGVVHNDATGNLSTSLLATADLGTSANLQIPDGNLASAPTSARTVNTIVKRDASNNINADLTGAVTGAASQNVLKTGDTMTGNLNVPSVSVTSLTTAGVVHNNASGSLSTSLLATADLGNSVNLQIPDNNLASLPTTNRTANTIVKRDASNNINADLTGAVTGAASLNVLKAGDTMTGGLTLPSAKVTGLSTIGLVHNDASGNLSTSLLATADLGTSANLQIPDGNLASAPTSVRTANTIVKRDASSNINADLTGAVTGAASLNVLKAGDTMTGTLNVPTVNATTSTITPAVILTNSGKNSTVSTANATGSFTYSLPTISASDSFVMAAANQTLSNKDLSSATNSCNATKLQGVAVSATAPGSNQVLQYNGTNWAPATITTGASSPNVANYTGSQTLTGTNYLVNVNSASACTITLPANSAVPGQNFIIFNIGTTTVTVATAGTDTVALIGTTLTLSSQYDFCNLISNGSGIWISI